MARAAKDLFGAQPPNVDNPLPGQSPKVGLNGVVPRAVVPYDYVTNLQGAGAIPKSVGGQTSMVDVPDQLAYGDPISFRGFFSRLPVANESSYTPWPSTQLTGDISSVQIVDLPSIPHARGEFAGLFRAGQNLSTSNSLVRAEVGQTTTVDVSASGVTVNGYLPTYLDGLFRGATALGDRVGDDRYWGFKWRIPAAFSYAGSAVVFQSSPLLALFPGSGISVMASNYPTSKTLLFQVQSGTVSGTTANIVAGNGTIDINSTGSAFAASGWTMPQDTWVDIMVNIKYATDYTGRLRFWAREEGKSWVPGYDSANLHPDGMPTMKTLGLVDGLVSPLTDQVAVGQFHKIHAGMYLPGGTTASPEQHEWYVAGYVRGSDFNSVSDYLAGKTVAKTWHPQRVYDREVLHLGTTISPADGNAEEIISGIKRFDSTPNWACETITANYSISSASDTRKPVKNVDTTAAVITITLPSGPYLGEWYRFVDVANNFATHNCSINRNTNTIEGAASNLTLSANGTVLDLMWNGSTWKIINQVAGGSSIGVTNPFRTVQTLTYTGAGGTQTLVNGSASVVRISTSGMTSGSATVNLPAAPSVGTEFFIQDKDASFETWPIIIAVNGNTMDGSAGNTSLTVKNSSLYIIWNGTTWVSDSFAPFRTATFTGTTTLSELPGVGKREVLLCDTTSAAWTLTLPAAPTTGLELSLVDNANKWGTNNLTVAPNGKNIDGSASNLVLNVNQWHRTLRYDGTQWRTIAENVLPGTANPAMDGAASAGSVNTFSRSDHVHPTDTSRAQDSLVVHLAGAETVTGAKTFNASLRTVLTPASTILIDNLLISTDAQPTYRLLASGSMGWGAGGATARDAFLYRSGASVLKIDSDGVGGAATLNVTGDIQMNGVASTGSGANVRATTPTFVTPVLGAATGTSLALTGACTSSGGGIGYAAGAGGAVTQLTSRTTTVVLSKLSGAITLFAAAGATTWTTFTVTNTLVAATDTVIVCCKSGTNVYLTHVTAVAAGSFNISFATTGGVTSDSPVFNFAVIKAVAA